MIVPNGEGSDLAKVVGGSGELRDRVRHCVFLLCRGSLGDDRIPTLPVGRISRVHLASDVPALVGRIPKRTLGLHLEAITEGNRQVDASGNRHRIDSGSGGSSSGSSGFRDDFRIDLGVQVDERFLRIGGESRDGLLDCLHLVTEDAVVVHDGAETTSGDHVVDATGGEGLADDLRPLREVVRELLVTAVEVVHQVEDNLALLRARRVLLLKRDLETLKERFVLNASTGETLGVLTTLTLRVRGRDDRETGSRNDLLVDLLEVDTLTLKDRLKTHHLVRTKIDLVEEEDSAALHRKRNRSVLPDSLTVDETETAEEIILIGRSDDVDAQTLALESSTHLLDHRRLAVAGKTGDVDRVEATRTDDRLDVLEVTVRDIERILLGDQRSTRHRVRSGRNDTRRESGRSRSDSGDRSGSSNDSRSGNASDAATVRLVHRGEFRAVILAVTSTTRVVLHQPSRHRDAVLRLERLDLCARERRSVASVEGERNETIDLLIHGSHSSVSSVEWTAFAFVAFGAVGGLRERICRRL
jgi:CBS domain-containing protein